MVDWNPKANALFLQAVEMPSPGERQAFLDEACAGDSTLRVEVEQLLKAHEEAGNFLERPLLGDQQTQDWADATDRDDPPGASPSDRGEVALDFLEPCDAPGRLGKIGPYEVIEVIGVGGMGVVLRAHDPKLNRIVAVKVMAPPFVANPTARKRFLREAQATAAVTHPHVIAIHAVDQTDKTPYLVMEFIDGLSLEEKINRCGHLEVKEILRIGAQIAAGLAAAHAHGLVHRDIKPSNILLENGVERVRITDFGLARAVDDVSVTRSGEVTGTPQFMSPEQAQGSRSITVATCSAWARCCTRCVRAARRSGRRPRSPCCGECATTCRGRSGKSTRTSPSRWSPLSTGSWPRTRRSGFRRLRRCLTCCWATWPISRTRPTVRRRNRRASGQPRTGKRPMPGRPRVADGRDDP